MRTDSIDYLRIAAFPLTNANFWTYTRPMGAPLFYKLVGDTPSHIILMQAVVSIAAWSLLAWAASRSLRSRRLQVPAFALVLLFSLSAGITQWDTVILSELLSLSFLALWLAAWLWLLDGWRPAAMAAVCVVGFLFVFTREINAYLGLAAGLILLAAYFAGRKIHAIQSKSARAGMGRKPLLLGLVLAAVFAVNAPLSSRGERWVFPLLNVIAQRVLPSQEFTAFFQSRGMPVNATLLELKGQWGNSQDSAFYNSNGLRHFQAWLYREGRVAYYDFLFSHPGWTVAEPVRNAGGLLSPGVRSYGPDNYQGALPGWLEAAVYPGGRMPLWSYVWLGLAAGTLAIAAAQRRQLPPGWLVGAAAVALVYPHAALVYHGDVMELARHAIGVAVQARIGVWLVLLFALDGLTYPPGLSYPPAPSLKGRGAPVRVAYPIRAFVRFLGSGMHSAAFLATALLAASALEGMALANRYQGPAYSLMPMLLLTLCLAAAMVWVYRKPQILEPLLAGLEPGEEQPPRKTPLYGLSLGLLFLVGLCILALALFSPPNSPGVAQALSVNARLAGLYGALQALVAPLRPGIAWLGLIAVQAKGALAILYFPFYKRLWREEVVYRLGAAALVVAAGIGQAALLYLRLPWLQEITGWKYPYRAVDVELTGQLVFLGLLALAVVVTMYAAARPMKLARYAVVVMGTWIALAVGFIFLTFEMGAHEILADVLVRVGEMPVAGFAVLLFILTGIALDAPLAPLLMVVTPIYLLDSLSGQSEINSYLLPLAGIMALWLGHLSIHRKALWASLTAGFISGAGFAIAPPVAFLFLMLVAWVWIDAALPGKERDIRGTAIMTAGIAAGAGVGLLLALQMGNNPLPGYLQSLEASRHALGLHLGLYSWLARLKLDPFELAFFAGLPLAALAALRAGRAGYALVRRTARRMDALALAFSLACAALMLALPPFGGTAQSWMFLLPPMALLAGDEITRLFPGKWAALVIAMQFAILFLALRFLR